MDGNFRVPRLASRGTATLHDPPIRDKFLPDDLVREFCKERENNLAPIDANDCNEFDADKQLARTKSKFDITGRSTLVKRACKHLKCWNTSDICVSEYARHSIHADEKQVMICFCFFRHIWSILSAWLSHLRSQYVHWGKVVICNPNPVDLAGSKHCPKSHLVRAILHYLSHPHIPSTG